MFNYLIECYIKEINVAKYFILFFKIVYFENFQERYKSVHFNSELCSFYVKVISYRMMN
jgi:hypothetical protein